jgi:hypothetical protein
LALAAFGSVLCDVPCELWSVVVVEVLGVALLCPAGGFVAVLGVEVAELGVLEFCWLIEFWSVVEVVPVDPGAVLDCCPVVLVEVWF